MLEDLRKVLRLWLDHSQFALRQAARLESQYGSVDGADELRSMVRQAEASLAPDHEFFAGEKLNEAEERAIKCYKAGETEPLFDDERGH